MSIITQSHHIFPTGDLEGVNCSRIEQTGPLKRQALFKTDDYLLLKEKNTQKNLIFKNL